MAKTLLSMQDLQARALAEIRKQPGCHNVQDIAINRVTDEHAENNWSLCVLSDHQRRLASDAIGEPSGADGTHQPQPKGYREHRRHFDQRNVERFRDRYHDQQEDREVERIERPTQPSRDPRDPLIPWSAPSTRGFPKTN